MTFSYYYADPDGNNVELQVDNFGDWSKSTEWMRTSDEFQANPIGQFVDPDLVAADHADGIELRRRSTRRRWPVATRRSRRRSRSQEAVVRLCRFDAGAGARHGIVDDGFVVDRDDPSARHALDDVRLLAPVLPRKFLAIGLNYADHIAEIGNAGAAVPGLLQQAGHVRGRTRRRRAHAAVSSLLDYEGELAIVIGTRCRHVPRGPRATR